MPLSLASANLLGAGISAIGSLAGNALGGVSSYRSAKKLLNRQLEWQEQMYDKQVATNRENWNMQNEYNSPANQRKLMEDAGYNVSMTSGDPSTVASSDNVGSSSFPSPASYTPVQNILGDALTSATSAFASLVNAKAQLSNANSNAINASVNVANSETSTGYYNHLNALTREQIGIASQENKFKSEYLQESINQIKAQTNLTTLQTGIARITGEWMPAEKSLQLSQLSAQIDNILQDTKNKKLYPSIASAQIKQLLANAEYLISQKETVDALRPSTVDASEANAVSANFHAYNMEKGVSDTFTSDKWLSSVSVSANGSLNLYGGSAGASATVPRGVVTDGVDAILKLADGLRKRTSSSVNNSSSSLYSVPYGNTD